MSSVLDANRLEEVLGGNPRTIHNFIVHIHSGWQSSMALTPETGEYAIRIYTRFILRGSGDRYKLKGILRTKASTRSPQQTPYSFYVPQSTVDPVAVSSREIAKVIDYSVLPDDHPLSKRSRDDPVDEPELLGEYTRIKGTVTHTLAAGSYDDAQAVLDEELAKLMTHVKSNGLRLENLTHPICENLTIHYLQNREMICEKPLWMKRTSVQPTYRWSRGAQYSESDDGNTARRYRRQRPSRSQA